METLKETHKILKDKLFGIQTAYFLLRKSDQEKYGILTTGLSSKYYMNNNKYPIKLTYATYTTKRHCHDNCRSWGKNIHSRQNEIQRTKQKPTEKTDHKISVITDTSFSQISEGKCYCCGKSGNYLNNFIENIKSKIIWWIDCQV